MTQPAVRPSTGTRAIAYIRVSTEREEMISPELQLNAIQTHCAKFGYDIIEVVEDLDLSGRFWKRRKVEQVIASMERREAEVMVVWKISRVSRNRKDWAIAVDRVESVGGRMESATEPMDTTTSSGRFARGMLAELAVFESERIGETWKETHARRIRNGLPHHGLPRFGYTYDKAAGYTVDPASGPVLAQMYRRYIAGQSLYDLGRYAASEGFAPENGWSVSTMRRMLDRGFGAGYVWTKGTLIPGAHEAVITKDEFAAYQSRRESRATAPRSEASEYPYSGLVKCPECGGRMSGSHVTKPNGKKYERYMCLTAINKGSHPTFTISARYVDKAVREWLEGVAAEIDRHTPSHAPHRNDGMKRKASQIEADLKKNAARTDALLVKYLDGDVAADVYTRMTSKLAEEKSTLEARQRMVQMNTQARPADLVPKLLAEWDRMPGRVKREVLNRLLDRIQLHTWEDGGGKRKITVHEHGWEK